MSYINITLGGNSYGWQYNMAGAAEVATELTSNNSMLQMYALTYAGLYGYAIFDRKPVSVTWSEVVTMVDALNADQRTELLNQITAEFLKAQPDVKGDAVADVSEEKKTQDSEPSIT